MPDLTSPPALHLAMLLPLSIAVRALSLLQDHLQHVHPEAATRLLRGAVHPLQGSL